MPGRPKKAEKPFPLITTAFRCPYLIHIGHTPLCSTMPTSTMAPRLGLKKHDFLNCWTAHAYHDSSAHSNPCARRC